MQVMSHIFLSASKASIKQLKAQIPDDINLQKALIPQFKFGCKRLLLTNDYYPALNMPNCTVHSSKITKVNDHSITMENGVTQKLDVIVNFYQNTIGFLEFMYNLVGSHFGYRFPGTRLLCSNASYRNEF